MKIYGILLMGLILLTGGIAIAAADDAETERFVRARIEIAESMQRFMEEMGGPERFRPGPGGMSVEEMHRLTEEINRKIAAILERHGLTLEAYRGRGPEIFSDKPPLEALFEARPELRDRYEAIPEEAMGFRRRREME